MKTKPATMFWPLITLFLLAACAKTEFKSPVPLDNEYTNRQIKLLIPQQFNSYKTTSSIVLEVQYYSNNDIIFPNNYNVEIFKQAENSWVEVSEKPIVRLPKDDIVFSADKNTNAIRLFTVDPELVDYSLSYNLRFYIFGNMKVGQQIKQVIAYADIKLSP